MILLDEVEKAHPDVFDVLLQVLDDGRLTDGQGRTVDFRNAILILTSNLGSSVISDLTLAEEQRREGVLAVVRSHFKPEFLNRLDDIVVFASLRGDDLRVDRRHPVGPDAAPAGRPPADLEITDAARTGSPSTATTRSTALARCGAWSRRRSATSWPRRCCPARSATAKR